MVGLFNIDFLFLLYDVTRLSVCFADFFIPESGNVQIDPFAVTLSGRHDLIDGFQAALVSADDGRRFFWRH
jgi:hypothetical protein